MRKAFAVLPALLLAFGFLSGGTGTADDAIAHNGPTINRLADETIDYPSKGTVDDASCMMSRWQASDFGFKRIDDERVAVHGTSGWGERCDYGPTTFGIDRFEMSVDLTDWPNGEIMGLSFGDQGSYVSETSAGLVMDVVKYTYYDERNVVMVCLNTGPSGGYDHNYTIDGWGDGSETFLDAYSGAVVSTPDNVLTIGWTVSGGRVTMYANDYSATFDYDVIFANLSDEFCVNFGGGYNGGDTYFIVNYVRDAEDMEYYAEGGTYYTAKAEVEAFAAAVNSATLNTINDFIEVYAIGDAIAMSSLYDHDEVYLGRTYDPAMNSLLSAGHTAFGNEAYIALLDYQVDKLSDITLDDEEALYDALERVDKIAEIHGWISALELTEAEQSEVNQLLSAFAALYEDIEEAAGEIYEAIVNEVVTAMNNASTLAEVREAEMAYNSMSTSLRGYVSADVLAEIEEALNAARAAFLEKYGNVSADSGFVSGENVRVVEGEETIGFTAWGNSGTADQSGSGLLYTREALDVIDFSVDYTVENFNYYAISIMANPTFFSSAEDETILNYKGFVFLIRELNETQAYLQPFLIDGTCGRFYDGQLTTNDLIIDKTGDIHFEMSVRQVTTSGLITNYLVFSFNGVEYETPLVQEMSVLGAFSDGKGYFGIGAQSGSIDNPLAITLNQINGKAVTSDSLLNDDINYAPVPAETSYTYTLGSTSNLTIGLDPRLQTSMTFAVDGETLTSNTHYTYQRNSTLTLLATYLNTLEEGEHTLTMTSAAGSTDVTLIIEAASETPDTETGDTETGDGLPGWAIALIVVGAVVVVGGITALILVLRKKKTA